MRNVMKELIKILTNFEQLTGDGAKGTCAVLWLAAVLFSFILWMNPQQGFIPDFVGSGFLLFIAYLGSWSISKSWS
jgi:hypothetical protein